MTILRKFSIGIIDTSGLKYSHNSVETEFLPPAQTAIINIAESLFEFDFFVTVLNARRNSGLYNYVNYQPLESLNRRDYQFDIVISVDSVLPFDPNGDPIYQQIQRPDQLKILWSHSRDVVGGENLEKFIVNKNINQIFTVSDRHTNELINGLTDTRRMYEVLKNHVFQTRYGIRTGYTPDPVIYSYPTSLKNRKKSGLLFNYNDPDAAELLITEIFPRIQNSIADAELFISVDLTIPAFDRLYQQYNNQNSITFLTDAGYRSRISYLEQMVLSLYPSTEWSNQSQSLIENTYLNIPVLGFQTSSFAESIGEHAAYVIKNTADWDRSTLIERFTDQAVNIIQNIYRHQQTMYGCNLTKEILDWKSIALQWKQHFYHTFGSTLEGSEFDRCQWTNYRVNHILKKIWINSSEVQNLKPITDSQEIKYSPMTVAFVDLSGSSYDGSTLAKRGLGGSESAVISMARELAKIGFQITVFNACNEDDCRPGVYDNVEYLPLNLIVAQSSVYDVVISLRTPEIFANPEQFEFNFGNARRLPIEHYDLLKRAKLKVLWMHDTFSRGDELVQTMIENQQIDQVWTLSDFHRNYFLNCNHGSARNYSILKNHVWTTRNGINRYIESVDLTQKDPNLFVYNANLSKGLKPLLQDIWPRVRERIPEARLTVIGGYYELGAIFSQHQEKNKFESIVEPYREDPSITFTGIITQAEVAEIVHHASYFIYPCDLPETFSISAWESLALGTPLITCRFGALEETALENYSYLIDYPVKSNALFPYINEQEQIEKFVDLTVQAYQDQQLKEKQQVCQAIADIATWATVALEWKQHIYQYHGRYLSGSENRRVNYSLNRYQQLTKRKTVDNQAQLLPKLSYENRIVIITPFRNVGQYIEKCILSVAAQRYSNYHHYIINDSSEDNSSFLAQLVIQNLPEAIQNRFTFISRDRSYGAVYNQVDTIRKLDNNDIVILLDGDDYLANRADIFDLYNYLYHEGAEFTYGSIWSEADDIPLVAQTYSEFTKSSRQYRGERFNWYIPYTHLRTFRKYLINNVPDSDFQDNKNQWFRAGGDVAVFYNLIEQADPARIRPVHDIVYHYNDNLLTNDFRQNQEEQHRNAQMIVSGEYRNKIQKRILIAIPTARYIESATFKAIYDQILPKEYEVDFQYFYGYNVDQVRNLIASWAVNYDYLWAVDSDISFPKDTLQRLIDHDCDVVSAVYRQRIPGQTIIELYRSNDQGGVTNIPWDEIKGQGLVEIQACGFGCVLVKSNVLREIGYPQFQYYSAIDHEYTISEDVDFCRKARARGFRIWADTSILCDHHGSIIFGMNQ